MVYLLLFIVDVNECEDRFSSGCAQECTNTVGSFECSCNSSYELASDGFLCKGETIDHYANRPYNSRSTKILYFLISTVGGTVSGFYYATDIDECALGTDNCHQRCVNTEGSLVCACSRGFSLMNDGINCARKFRLAIDTDPFVNLQLDSAELCPLLSMVG